MSIKSLCVSEDGRDIILRISIRTQGLYVKAVLGRVSSLCSCIGMLASIERTRLKRTYKEISMRDRYFSALCKFFQMKDMSAEGTLRPETKCWAQGMDGWRPLQNIPQLKWYLLATGNAVMNETDLAVLILNMLIKICEFYPNRLQHQFHF